MPGDDDDLTPLFDAILATVPAPAGDPDAPLQAIVTNLDASDYLGRLAIGRVVQRHAAPGRAGGAAARRTRASPRSSASSASSCASPASAATRPTTVAAGDLFVVAGFPEVEIGDTIADPGHARSPCPASPSTSPSCG